MKSKWFLAKSLFLYEIRGRWIGFIMGISSVWTSAWPSAIIFKPDNSSLSFSYSSSVLNILFLETNRDGDFVLCTWVPTLIWLYIPAFDLFYWARKFVVGELISIGVSDVAAWVPCDNELWLNKTSFLSENSEIACWMALNSTIHVRTRAYCSILWEDFIC